MKQSDYKRYYFYFNDAGLLTVQLTNDPVKDCIAKTADAMLEQYKRGKHAGHAEQFAKDFEEEFEPKLEADTKGTDLPTENPEATNE